MADVRSMLRAQREARKVNHQHASYTSDGKLLCNLCETNVKEAAWQAHLRSTQHTLRESRAKDAAATRTENGPNKKRKAATIDSPSPEDRKKSKPSGSIAPDVEEDGSRDEHQGATTSPADANVAPLNMPPETGVREDEAMDAAEAEAFERELQEMDARMSAGRSAQTHVTITAAPMTAEEIAAQAREEQSAQRGRRDAEIEGEKEDAARLLEEEFEEMEGLEERVKRLREKREALRTVDGVGLEGKGGQAMPSKDIIAAVNGDAAEASDEEDEDEDYDDWNFGKP